MASVLKDPAVVEAIAKAKAKGFAEGVKAASAKLKDFHLSHVGGLGDDKAAVKTAKAYGIGAAAAVKSPTVAA